MSSEMKKVISSFVLLLSFLLFVVPCFAQEPGFTREDRERLVRVEATLTGVVIGFAYWDKRTIIRKARDEAKC